MIFFRKKKPEAKGGKAPVKVRSLQELVQERILTAEGWRRRILKKGRKK